MAETKTDDLGLRVVELDVYRKSVVSSLDRQVNGAKAQYVPLARMSKYGYPEIGEPLFVGYEQHDIDLALPSGKSRGVVFEPNDSTRQFKATFVEIPSGLYRTYDSVGETSAKDNLRNFVMYAIPDGFERLVAPRPKIYNAHGKRVL